VAVVELGTLGDTEPAPQPGEATCHLPLLFAAKDLDGYSPAAEVDCVERVEGDGTCQVTRTDEVDLVDGVGADEQRRLRIGRPLGDVAIAGAPLGNPSAFEDAIDGPGLRRL